jgi:Flp pilus assembly pilin Flp
LVYKGGMSAIEYGLIAACVLIAIITVVNGLGTKLKTTLAELTAIRRASSRLNRLAVQRRGRLVLEAEITELLAVARTMKDSSRSS